MTEKEKRERLMGDRRMALESIRDIAKWTAAALLTINGGAVVLTLNRGGDSAVSVAGDFASGVFYTIVAGFFGALGALIALDRVNVELGIMKETGWGSPRVSRILMGACLMMVPVGLVASLYSLLDGIEAHYKIETQRLFDETDKVKKEWEAEKKSRDNHPFVLSK